MKIGGQEVLIHLSPEFGRFWAFENCCFLPKNAAFWQTILRTNVFRFNSLKFIKKYLTVLKGKCYQK
jgi:hypothetical protein